MLAGRYRVEDLLDHVDGVRSWRAVDEVLSRAVYVQTLPADDPRAAQITAAARAAAQVRDSRFLQVLDVDVEGGVAYVVREWTSGRSLTMVLADGPLSADQAAALAHEVAAAMATAHETGLTHQLLRPGSIVITPDGRVKIAGLATEVGDARRELRRPKSARCRRHRQPALCGTHRTMARRTRPRAARRTADRRTGRLASSGSPGSSASARRDRRPHARQLGPAQRNTAAEPGRSARSPHGGCGREPGQRPARRVQQRRDRDRPATRGDQRAGNSVSVQPSRPGPAFHRATSTALRARPRSRRAGRRADSGRDNAAGSRTPARRSRR